MQAEHLSTRTRSWLYIAAQHPGSNLPFIHYASIKLRKRPKALARLHAVAGNVLSSLADESRQTVTELSCQVREQKGEIEGLQNQVKQYENLLKDKETDLQILSRAMGLIRSNDPAIMAALKVSSASPVASPVVTSVAK